MTATTTAKRQRFGGYGLTEMRRYAREYGIKGRSKMDGHQLLAALKTYWHDTRVTNEQAVIAAAVKGALLRHKSSGTIMRLTSDVIASDNPAHDGALRFIAEYVEVGDNDGGLIGAWKGRGVDRARYLNEEEARYVEHRGPTWHMLWQHEAV